jgi:membrane-bound acyltransferase YfiQ involved in biofilm formation
MTLFVSLYIFFEGKSKKRPDATLSAMISAFIWLSYLTLQSIKNSRAHETSCKCMNYLVLCGHFF